MKMNLGTMTWLAIEIVQIIFTVRQPYAVFLTLNLACVTLAFWLIAGFYELSGMEMSPAAKSYLKFVLFTEVVNNDSIAWD